MSALAVVLIIVAALVIALAIGGVAGNARLQRSRGAGLGERVAQADAALAAAYAEDRGWERAGLEAAARDAWSSRYPGQRIDEMHLIEVTDRPGTDEDLAVFRVVGDGEPAVLRLGRRDGEWYPADVHPGR